MKALNALFVSAAALGLAACSISIEDDGHQVYDGHGRSHMSVTLPSGERDGFSCPKGTDSFVIDRTDEGKGMVYGCRTRDARLPDID
ncbi:MAG: hypothetical protein EP335_05570 [Alphaproteobacteria bacterium]|nr:MAG: hypothetical protein EP335_05570 [Alphaproteobacteria bacterium]